MAIYSVLFKPLSVLTKIPDAQTIFGAFANQYKKLYGESKLEELLEKENSIEPCFFMSSMFYQNVLPIPNDFSPNYNGDLSLSKVKEYKKYKKIKYFSKAVYLEYRKNKEKFMNEFYQNIETRYQICSKNILVMIDENILKDNYYINDYRTRNAINTDNDNRLFKDQVIYCHEELLFEVYLNLIDIKYQNEIIETFKSMNYISIGGYKSIGYNLFSTLKVEKIDTFDTLKPEMLISKAVIDKNIDFDRSFYQLEVINNKYNGKSDKVYRKQVIVLCEGSVLSTNTIKLGNMIEDELNNKKIYQYYLGMLI